MYLKVVILLCVVHHFESISPVGHHSTHTLWVYSERLLIIYPLTILHRYVVRQVSQFDQW